MVPSPTVYTQGGAAVPADGLNTFCQTVLNVAQLRTITGQPNMQAAMLGTISQGDGGGGPFYWNANSTAADNGTTIIRPTGSTVGAWLRLGYYAATSGGSNLIYISQLKQGLATADPTMAVAIGIPSLPYDLIAIGWTGTFMTIGSALYNYVQATLGYSGAQMLAFFNSCMVFPVSP